MVLKTKLSLGLGFLFFIILALVGFCTYYVGTLAQEADNILKDNYNSIVYSRNMLSALDDMRTSVANTVLNPARTGKGSAYSQQLFESGRNIFDANLKEENNNITEIHEKEYVERLNQDYGSYLKLCDQMKEGVEDNSVYFNDFLPATEKLKQSINGIYDLNMQAVVRKTQMTRTDSSRFKTSMAIIGTLCLMLALAYFWYFPVYISTTLGYLSNKMKNLLKGIGAAPDEYSNDEAFVLLHGLDVLENKLGVKSEDGDGVGQ
jgi:two-component system, NtrC family, sensor histidine kinase KinB